MVSNKEAPGERFMVIANVNRRTNQIINSAVRWRLCHSAEEHRGSAGGDGSDVFRRDCPRAGVLAQLWHRAP